MVSIEGVGDYLLNLMVLGISVLIGGAVLVGGFYLFKKWKQHKEYKIVIWQLNGFGQPEIVRDTGGVYVDKKTNAKRLFLRKTKVDLGADQIPYLPDGKGRVVYLRKYGLKNFRYIYPKFDREHMVFEVGEEDVNWALNSYERGKKAFSMDKLLQYMPYIALGFVAIIVLIISIYIIKQWSVLTQVGDQMVQITENLARAKSGTTVIQ